MSMLCKFCSSVWLIRAPDGSLVLEDGSKHLCPKAPWILARKGRAMARAVKKEEISKVDDYMLLADIHEKMKYWNWKLVNFQLDLHVNPKEPKR